MAQLSQRLDKEILFLKSHLTSVTNAKLSCDKQVAVETKQFDINAKDPAMMVDPPEVVNFKRIDT